MCGITGHLNTRKGKFINKEAFKDVKRLLVLNQDRGEDSTGLACLAKKCVIYRDTISAEHFVKGIPFKSNYKLLLGHTRFATIGAVTKENSHPINFGNIVGIHNGSVSNYASLCPTVQVDSMAIFKMLNEEENDFIKVFPRLSGSFAIAWANLREPNTLYLVRNGNPLFLAITDTGYFFSSIELSLKAILTGKIKSLFELPENIVYKLSENNIETFSVRFKEPAYNYSRYNYSSCYDYGDDYGVPCLSQKAVATEEEPKYKQFFDEYVEGEGWELFEGKKHICQSCGTKDADVDIYIRKGVKYCYDCLKFEYNW